LQTCHYEKSDEPEYQRKVINKNSTDLKASFHPVDLRCLEKLCGPQNLEQVSLVERFRVAMVKLVQNVALEQFLIAYTNFHRVIRRAMLLVPFFYEWHIDTSATNP
jgi:uncharacterized protein (UPF0262 family)